MQTVAIDHWDKNTKDFLSPYLHTAQRFIRIATGFFTVQGYALFAEHFADKHIQIMVGFDETAKERLKAAFVEDVLAHLSRWDAVNRRIVVEELVDKLRRGQIQIVELGSNTLDARIRKKDHGKIYIIDDALVVLGSSNLTDSGQRANTEIMGAIEDPERVQYYVTKYEEYWHAPDTYDLTQDLLDALLRWLDLRRPYDVYLKTIAALIPEDFTEAPRDFYKMPVQYQRVIIERVLRQLRDYRGSMLVASTGLGKTIMATHAALRLRQEGLVFHVVIFAPKAVLPDWKHAMQSAGLSAEFFTRELLDQPTRGRAVTDMDSSLQRIDGRCLIVLDESQYFKNRLRGSDSGLRRSIERLSKIVGAKAPYVLLLTATPLAKGVEDINHQLALLPHTAPPSNVDSKGQYFMLDVLDDIPRQVWKVPSTEDYFERFINLPVCTMISTSQVAKSFAVNTPQGDYIDFGDMKKWIPRIEISKIRVPVPLETEVSEVLHRGYLKHELNKFISRGKWRFSETSVQLAAETAWMSSPPALTEVLAKCIEENGYAVRFYTPLERRRQLLNPLLHKLRELTYYHDDKFQALCRYLREFKEQEQKVLIFVERHPTAVYLEQSLKAAIPGLRVATSSLQKGQDYELKDFEGEVFDMIRGFAPEANADKINPGETLQPYDVFITTDAYSAGVNMQDASVVVSYDLAWTPDVIIQRAGRILRLWKSPRTVHLFVFVGNFQQDKEKRIQTEGVERRLRILSQRSQQAQKFSELPVFPEEDSASYTSLADLSSVVIEDLGFVNLFDLEEHGGRSRFLAHITELQKNSEYAAQLPDDISSALAYNGRHPQLHLLLRHEGKFHWMLYDIQERSISIPQEDVLLERIQCTPETQVAFSDASTIERTAQEAKSLWCTENSVPSGEVERICALFLQPQITESPNNVIMKVPSE